MKTPAEILNMLHRDYTYILDKKQYGHDHMTSHFDAVMEGQAWKDDCDGFAATAAELLLHEGYARENVKLVICTLKQNNEMHLVAGLDTQDGDTIIFDCNFHDVYSWNRKKAYTWNYYMPLNEPGQWYKIEN